MTLPDYPTNLDFVIGNHFRDPNAIDEDGQLFYGYINSIYGFITRTDGEVTETSGTLLDTSVRLNNDAPIGTGITITYNFSESDPFAGPDGPDPNRAPFKLFSDELKDIVRQSFEKVARYVDIQFVETAADETIDGAFHLDIVGRISSVSRGVLEDTGNVSLGGSIELGIEDFGDNPDNDARTTALADDEQYNDGTFPAFEELVLHELGHVLQLLHPVDSNTDAYIAENFGDTSGATYYAPRLTELAPELNTDQFTVMVSGFTGSGPHQAFSELGFNAFLGRDGYAILDILALQRLYGATDYAATDTVWTFRNTDARQEVVYDSGGNDTFDFSNQDLGVIGDLREGAFSSVGELRDQPSFNVGVAHTVVAPDNIAIAFGTIIENAVGSDHHDQLTGNSAINVLHGNGGNDLLDGGAGNDFLTGGAGQDTISAGADNDQIFAGRGDESSDLFSGGAGDDTIGGGKGDDFIVGGELSKNTEGAGNDIIFGGAGNDFIITASFDDLNADGIAQDGEILTDQTHNAAYGGSGDDTLTGGDGRDTLGGGVGSDTIFAGAGHDIIYGGKEEYGDMIFGGDGNDTIYAAKGDDIINGGDGKDILFGGKDNDEIDAGLGDDDIYGGSGNDTLTGNSGSDIFYFGGEHGTDIITDFDVNDDMLILKNAVTDFQSTQDVIASSQATDNGITIDTGAGQITLNGLTVSDLEFINFGF